MWHMRWVGENKDLLALVLAVIGLLVSLNTVRLSVRQARLNAYTRIHELLVSPEIAKGRRMLFLANAANALPEPGDPGWDEINQSLAMYDTLGVYVGNRIVSRKLVLESWHHPLTDIRGPALAFLEHRRGHRVRNPWPSLRTLLDEAAGYRSKADCCASAEAEPTGSSAGRGQPAGTGSDA
jgi:hypothetical protein